MCREFGSRQRFRHRTLGQALSFAVRWGGDELQQLRRYLGVAVDDVAGLHVVGFARKIADQSAGFGDQQDAGRPLVG